MSGFLALFDGKETVDLGNGYACTIRKFLSEDDFAAAADALVPVKKLAPNGIEGAVDTKGYSRVLVLRALVSWTLDDENGNMLPITLDTIKRLPQVVFAKILAAVQNNNTEDEGSAATQREFRGANDSSDQGQL